MLWMQKLWKIHIINIIYFKYCLSKLWLKESLSNTVSYAKKDNPNPGATRNAITKNNPILSSIKFKKFCKCLYLNLEYFIFYIINQ